jgi:tetratricopeptide (TPR) repeat protein
MEIGPNFPVALFVKGLAHEQLGQYEEAVKNFQNAQESGGVYTIMKAAEGHAYAKMSRKEEALRIANELIELSESQYVSPYTIATVFAGLGDIDKTFLWLRKAVENDSFWQIHLHFQSDPRFQDIRKNPNYVEILKE